MARNEHPPCAAVLRDRFGDAVSTVPPSRQARPYVCPHGITYWVEAVRERGPQSWPSWLRYLVAIPLMAAWVVLSSVAVASSAWLAVLCDAGVNSAVGCGVVMFVAATACTWFLVDGLVCWAEGGAA